jgi:outer membrane protein assembly factor BamB
MMPRLRPDSVSRSCRAALAALVLTGIAASPAWAHGGEIDWPQFQGGAAHPGVLSEGPPPPYRQLWRFTPGSAVSGAVITGELAITVGTTAVYALDLATGDVVWQVPRDGGRPSIPAIGVIGDRQVLVYLEGPAGAENGDASATPSASATGTPSSSTAPSASASPVTSASASPSEQSPSDGGTSDLVAIDLEDRSELWRVPLQGESHSGVTVDGDRAFVADGKGYVYAFALDTGAAAWPSPAQGIGRIESPVAVADGMVYAASRDPDGQKSQVLALNEESGERVWEFSPQVGAAAVSGLSVADGMVVVGAADRYVRALDAGSGDVKWQSLALTLFSPASAPSFQPGNVFIGDASGGLYRIDPADGSRDWGYQLNDLIVRSSPVVVGQDVLVGLNDGRLVAIDVESGDLVWQSSKEPGLIGAVALSHDTVVAVKGGSDAGLVAFEHDPEGALVRIPSPTVVDPAELFGRFALAMVVTGLVIYVPFRLIRSRIGPAFANEEERVEGAEDEDGSAEDEDDDPGIDEATPTDEDRS